MKGGVVKMKIKIRSIVERDLQEDKEETLSEIKDIQLGVERLDRYIGSELKILDDYHLLAPEFRERFGLTKVFFPSCFLDVFGSLDREVGGLYFPSWTERKIESRGLREHEPESLRGQLYREIIKEHPRKKIAGTGESAFPLQFKKPVEDIRSEIEKISEGKGELSIEMAVEKSEDLVALSRKIKPLISGERAYLLGLAEEAQEGFFSEGDILDL